MLTFRIIQMIWTPIFKMGMPKDLINFTLMQCMICLIKYTLISLYSQVRIKMSIKLFVIWWTDIVVPRKQSLLLIVAMNHVMEKGAYFLFRLKIYIVVVSYLDQSINYLLQLSLIVQYPSYLHVNGQTKFLIILRYIDDSAIKTVLITLI